MIATPFNPQRPTHNMLPRLGLLVSTGIVLASQAVAHEHHGDEIPEGEAVSAEPIVRLSLQQNYPSNSNNHHRTLHYGSTSRSKCFPLALYFLPAWSSELAAPHFRMLRLYTKTDALFRSSAPDGMFPSKPSGSCSQ